MPPRVYEEIRAQKRLKDSVNRKQTMETTKTGSSPMNAPPPSFQANINRFSGLADTYDCYRPRPPEAFVHLVQQMAGTARPRRVVDRFRCRMNAEVKKVRHPS